MSIKPLVSVIIPVYNVEKYLEDCIESVRKQTLSSIEIILVDDGSPDQSGAICDYYASLDERIRVLHKENGGLSSARNAGVEIARADYIGFVDSDDTIEPEMYQVLYEALTTENADIAFCGMMDCYADFKRPTYKIQEGRFTVTAAKAIKMVMEAQNATVSAVTKLYKKSILLKHPFLLGKTFEDAHFIIPYLDDCNTVVFDMKPQYNYMHREGTITTRPYNKSNLSIIEAYTNNLAIVESKYPEALEAAQFRLYWSHFYVLDKILLSSRTGESEQQKKEIIHFLRRHYFKIIRNNIVGRGRKLALTGLMFHETVYKIFLSKYQSNKKLHQ